MKKLLFLAAFVILAFGAVAQQTIKGEALGNFSNVALIGSMDVEFTQSDTSGFEMELKDVNPSQVTWSISNGTLTIRVKPATLKQGSVLVKLSYKQIEGVNSNGADVIFKTPITGTMFTSDLTSGAKFTGTADCTDFELRITGNSAAQVDGRCKYATIVANQRSKVNARQLEAQSANVQAYMGSEIYICAMERVSAETSTAATIFYRGEPSIVRTSVKLGGSINDIGK